MHTDIKKKLNVTVLKKKEIWKRFIIKKQKGLERY